LATNIDPIYALIGAVIRDRRNEKGLTQEQLGEKVGLSRTSITNIEAGKQQMLLHSLRDIAQALGTSLDNILLRISERIDITGAAFLPNEYGVHSAHCCRKCGCKYGEPDCPVVLGLTPQLYPCPDCANDKDYLQECPRCGGTGCVDCDNTGEVPTPEGEKILELFKFVHRK
jgi:transcriptional regulator with XRE-family HTH domain